MRALIVDDSPLMRALLAEALPALGHEVVGEAQSPDEAVAAFRQHKPELVCLDLSLPGGDGFSILDQMRAEDPAVTVVIITANRQSKAVERALASGAKGVLCKPFDAAELQKLLSGLGA